MKKILLSALLLIIPLISYANTEDITFNILSSLRLDENEGQVYLPAIKLDLTNQVSKKLSFSISKQDFLIFANDISKIEINGVQTNIKAINLSEGNKKIQITLKEEKTGKIEIQGIQIRTYDQEIISAKIGYDYNNDDIIDLYSTNVIDLDENGRYSDNMKPLPVSNVRKTITKNKNGLYDININWDNSPDLDLYGSFIKVNKNNSYGNLKEEFIGKLDKQIFSYKNMDLENDVYKIEVFSKDFYYLNTNPFIINLNKKDLIKETIVEIVVKEKIPVIIKEVKTEKIKKYIPVFTKYKKAFDNFVILLDKYIDKKKKLNLSIEQNNNIMIIRNNLLIITEKFDKSTKENRGIILKELKSSFKKLKAVLIK